MPLLLYNLNLFMFDFCLLGTIEILEHNTEHLKHTPVYDVVTDFTQKSQVSQHCKGKERQARKFELLSSRKVTAMEPAWVKEDDAPTPEDPRDKWVKNLGIVPG